jgi:hypothetical protein
MKQATQLANKICQTKIKNLKEEAPELALEEAMDLSLRQTTE